MSIRVTYKYSSENFITEHAINIGSIVRFRNAILVWTRKNNRVRIQDSQRHQRAVV